MSKNYCENSNNRCNCYKLLIYNETSHLNPQDLKRQERFDVHWSLEDILAFIKKMENDTTMSGWRTVYLVCFKKEYKQYISFQGKSNVL